MNWRKESVIKHFGKLIKYNYCRQLTIGLKSRMVANGRQWRPGFNPRSSHTKDSKMVLDAAFLNTHHYKAKVKGKMKQSRQ